MFAIKCVRNVSDRADWPVTTREAQSPRLRWLNYSLRDLYGMLADADPLAFLPDLSVSGFSYGVINSDRMLLVADVN